MEKHIADLTANGIKIALTLTNHFFDKKSYEASLELLSFNHKKVGGFIINDFEE